MNFERSVVQPFRIKVTRFGKQKVGGAMVYAFLALAMFSAILLVGLPIVGSGLLLDAGYFTLDTSDLGKVGLALIAAFLGKRITYFGEDGELIFDETGISIQGLEHHEFKPWAEHRMSVVLDGYCSQRVNGKTRQGNRNYVEIATDSGSEKHFFQVFGKPQMDYLLLKLEALQGSVLVKRGF